MIYFGESGKIRKRMKEFKGFKKQLKHALHVDDDVLDESAKRQGQDLLNEADKIDLDQSEKIDSFLNKAPEKLNKIFPKKSWPTVREYADIIAVAMCVAFGIRAMFLQPFKIPTSSMQPTLFGIHYIADKGTLPHLPGFLHYMLFSTQRAECEVKRPGELYPESISSIKKYVIFPWTRFRIGDLVYDLPGDNRKVMDYCRLKDKIGQVLPKGEVLCNGWLSLGDHLFVDRYTFHFREPRRGDIIVFNTEDIKDGASRLVDRGYYYIKRLIGLPGDTLRIKDNKIYVTPKGSKEEKIITELAPVFSKLYSYKGGYHGHLNKHGGKHLSSEKDTFTVPEDSYFALGDNSLSSYDGRYWGVVPRKNLVGRAVFVFWPFSRRWGPADRKGPLDTDTSPGLPSMNLQ